MPFGAPVGDDNEEDFLWLSELCKAPRRSDQVGKRALQRALSDELWVRGLCRAPQRLEQECQMAGTGLTPHMDSTTSLTPTPAVATANPVSGKRPLTGSNARLACSAGQANLVSGSPVSGTSKKGCRRGGDTSVPEMAWVKRARESKLIGAVACSAGQTCHGLAPFASVRQLRHDIAQFLPRGRLTAAPSLPDLDSVLFALPQGPDAEEAVFYILQRFQMWQAAFDDIAAFKVGIAIDPVERYGDGYAQDGDWVFMDVVFRGSVQACHEMERTLIKLLQGIAGCYNIKPGGEGISVLTEATCHCYIVYAAAGLGVGLKRARHLATAVSRDMP